MLHKFAILSFFLGGTILNALIVVESTVLDEPIYTGFTDDYRVDRVLNSVGSPTSVSFGDDTVLQWRIIPEDGYFLEFSKPDEALSSSLQIYSIWKSENYTSLGDLSLYAVPTTLSFLTDSSVVSTTLTNILSVLNEEGTYVRPYHQVYFDSLLRITGIEFSFDYSSIASVLDASGFSGSLTLNILSDSSEPTSISSAFSLVPVSSIPEPNQTLIMLVILMPAGVCVIVRRRRLGRKADWN
jgi:hypothetical protein